MILYIRRNDCPWLSTWLWVCKGSGFRSKTVQVWYQSSQQLLLCPSCWAALAGSLRNRTSPGCVTYFTNHIFLCSFLGKCFLKNVLLLRGFTGFAQEVYVQQNRCFHVLFNLFFSLAHYTWPFFTPKRMIQMVIILETHHFLGCVFFVRCYFLRKSWYTTPKHGACMWSLRPCQLELLSLSDISCQCWECSCTSFPTQHWTDLITARAHFALLSWHGWFCWW